jgi:hypothetical protein
VTHGTAVKLLDVVFLDELFAQDRLGDRRLPVHGEYMLAGPDETFWFTVAREAPIHIKRLCAPHQWHLVDPSVTRYTTYAFFHMDTVIEVYETR